VGLCPTCKSSFHGDEQFCPRDGTPLRASLPEDPLAGRVLSGRYRLVEVIGRGGMGAVYRAHHILMDKAVAVKVLRQELASDTEAVARFHREARSASRLDHDHIIRVSDFGQTDDGLLFLVMELLDGENLAQVLRRGPLPWRRAAAIVRDVATGLAHAHEQGVIHRDLKPENIVLVRRSKSRQLVKVLDFGLAKLVQTASAGGAAGGGDAAGDAEPDVAVQSLTRTGVVFGTPEYMSPEQAEGRSLDARTDIYALGVVSYQMLSGKLPFSAPTFLALIAKTVNEPPPPLSEAIESPAVVIPAEVEELVLSCLAKSPDDRPQLAEEIAETLDQLLARFPEEHSRSGEVPATGAPAASGSGARRVETGSPVAGGVARTVQRQLPPGQAARTAPREPAGSSDPETPPLPRSGQRRLDSPLPSSGMPKSSAAQSAVRPAVDSAAPTIPASPKVADAAPEPDEEAPAAPPPRRSGSHAARAGSASAPAERVPERVPDSEPDADLPLTVPRRPYWVAALLVLVLGVGGLLWARPQLAGLGKPATPVEPEREPLRRARELLAQQPLGPSNIEEALRILREEREVHDTPEVHRLLSRAYEADSNRLRALGHLYAAVRLSTNPVESARSQLALSQLLSRFGHPHDACQAAHRVIAARPDKELRRQTEALLSTLHCAASAPGAAAAVSASH